MRYEKFKALRAQEKARLGIDEARALNVRKHLPSSERWLARAWDMTFLIVALGSLATTFLWKWWVGLILITFVCPAMFKAVKQLNSQLVMGYAEKNKEFYYFLLNQNIMVVQEIDSSADKKE